MKPDGPDRWTITVVPSQGHRLASQLPLRETPTEDIEVIRADRVEAVLVAADRLREAYEAMIDGRDVGWLADWNRPADEKRS